ncbi:hypothetical protein NX862_05060 [Rhodobacter sp. KR11]|uniref:hypothetical protein n=1 Tax=Rhodobacter sp. KR11 TaxID=2974588 RepID=UPI002221D513|nr:hypothetical protein [Rhodobacter sp. KR11]MCW1918116.1 hypothetical protein [Rhodobacter sp. KR11]
MRSPVAIPVKGLKAEGVFLIGGLFAAPQVGVHPDTDAILRLGSFGGAIFWLLQQLRENQTELARPGPSPTGIVHAKFDQEGFPRTNSGFLQYERGVWPETFGLERPARAIRDRRFLGLL